MKLRDTGYEYVKGIILASDIQIANLYETNNSLINVAYLMTTYIDIN
jgi:hypothetical protein